MLPSIYPLCERAFDIHRVRNCVSSKVGLEVIKDWDSARNKTSLIQPVVSQVTLQSVRKKAMALGMVGCF
jgi:hypothetical protein